MNQTVPSIPAHADAAAPQVPSLPLTLRKALEGGECVLFLGAGIGAHALDKTGKAAPNGEELAKRLAQQFGIDADGMYDLSKIAEIVELREGRKELETFLRDQLTDLEPDDTLKWLATLKWRAIFTTNYDYVIERAYELTAHPPQKPVSFSITPDLFPHDPRFDVPIYHLHGSFFGRFKPSIIITQSDYVTFREARHMLFEILKKEFATSTVLYVGYSNKDPNWQTVLSEVRNEFYPSPIPPSFRVAPETNRLDAELLRAKGVETLDMRLDEFVTTAAAALKEAKVVTGSLDAARKQIPPDLLPEFEKSPASVLRLLASWTYVNQADFGAHPNMQDFLKGDRPNWALLANRQYFQRDLEEDVYEELLDFATSDSTKCTTSLIIGPAGYGASTLLLGLATKLVGENAGPVFAHRSGMQMIQGDLEFAASLFPDKRPFFCIDNAAEHIPELAGSVHRMDDLKRPCCFLLASRTNEWRQRRPRIAPKEFELESLSDPEIHRLIDFLKANNAFKSLEALEPDMQFAVIKNKHGHELLVVMRELVEDNSFDAIIESEFRGIGNDTAKRLYLVVCCLYQHGAYSRDSLVAEVIGCSISEMYDKTSKETEGVVIFEETDVALGRYAARARHRKIAEIVWERCGDPGEKEGALQSTLSRLNLNYGMDKSAFEDLIRSDRVVDSLRTLEGRTHFFETACRKDPISPYVRQHYARMLDRAGKLDAALGQIDQAIGLNREVRVLYHTKGLILTKLAISSESTELGRRQLVKAERAFRTGLSMYARDEYAYQGLASLFLEWAKHVPAEAADYIAKSEEIINEGLRSVSNKESLWIVSAEIQKLVGSSPQYKDALNRAIKANPKSVIARYLLGQTLRRSGESQQAMEVLSPVIKENPDEYRCCLEYALAMLDAGDSYASAATVLKIGTLYGLRDPRYIATLGGMFFMAQRFTEADNIFAESRKREFSASQVNVIFFKPRQSGERQKLLRLVGKVVAVRGGYCFLEAPRYTRFMCPGTKWSGIRMEEGLSISFEPAFSAKGAQAEFPKIE